MSNHESSPTARSTDSHAEPFLNSRTIILLGLSGALLAGGLIVGGVDAIESKQAERLEQVLEKETVLRNLAIQAIKAGPAMPADVIGTYSSYPQSNIVAAIPYHAENAGHYIDPTEVEDAVALAASVNQFVKEHDGQYHTRNQFVLFRNDYNNDGDEEIFAKAVETGTVDK